VRAPETEATLRAETAAIADLLEQAHDRTKRLLKRAERFDKRNPRHDDDARKHSFAEWVYSCCELTLLDGGALAEAARDFRATSRTTDADLIRMKTED
jgi:hypothetical protein